MKKIHLLIVLTGLGIQANAQNTFPSSGNVGIGTTTPDKALQVIGDGIDLENTSFANPHGIIYKGGVRFISNFNYGNNGTVTTSGGNTFVGFNAGNLTMGSTATSASQASYNTVVGNGAFCSNTTGDHNTAIGYAALYHNTIGVDNNAVGYEALYANTTGKDNVAEGYGALTDNQTGSYNTAYGFEGLYFNTTGNYLTSVGYEALLRNTTGSYNVAVGSAALVNNNTGQYNTAMGYAALDANKTGSNNAAYGLEALYNDSSGSNNVAIGRYALFSSMASSNNTAVGYDAGHYIADGSSANTGGGSSIFIGASTKSQTASDNNEIVIGFGAVGEGSNSLVLGNTSIAKTVLQGNVLVGKTSQTNTAYKLDVNGDVRCNKVVVNTTGADYVFDSTYQMQPIDSLKAYIRVFHHLPGVPTASQMSQAGMDVGANQTTLLAKMEELTRYVIDLQDQLRQVQAENQAFRKALEEIKSGRGMESSHQNAQ